MPLSTIGAPNDPAQLQQFGLGLDLLSLTLPDIQHQEHYQQHQASHHVPSSAEPEGSFTQLSATPSQFVNAPCPITASWAGFAQPQPFDLLNSFGTFNTHQNPPSYTSAADATLENVGDYRQFHYQQQPQQPQVDVNNLSRSLLHPGQPTPVDGVESTGGPLGDFNCSQWEDWLGQLSRDNLIRLGIGTAVQSLNMVPYDVSGTLGQSGLVRNDEEMNLGPLSPLTDLSSRSVSRTRTPSPGHSLSSESPERPCTAAPSPLPLPVPAASTAVVQSAAAASAPAPKPVPLIRKRKVRPVRSRRTTTAAGRSSAVTPYAEAWDLHPDWPRFRAVRCHKSTAMT